jgi:hypothetical protein
MWLKKLFTIVLIFIVASCSHFDWAETLWNTPQPKPDFIAGYNKVPINEPSMPISQPMICIEFDEWAMVEAGDTVKTIEKDVESTADIELDGQKLPTNELLFDSPLSDDLMVKYDDNDNYLGSYVHGFTACFSTSKLTRGFHLSTIAFARTSGKTYSFSWAFKID